MRKTKSREAEKEVRKEIFTSVVARQEAPFGRFETTTTIRLEAELNWAFREVCRKFNLNAKAQYEKIVQDWIKEATKGLSQKELKSLLGSYLSKL